MSGRWWAPSPTVRVPRTPIHQLGARLGQLGCCCFGGGGGGCYFGSSCYENVETMPIDVGQTCIGPPLNPDAEVGDTGATVAQLEAAGYNNDTIAALMSQTDIGPPLNPDYNMGPPLNPDYVVPNTGGMTVGEMTDRGFTNNQIASMISGSSAPGATGSGGSGSGGSIPMSSPSKGGASTPALPTVPKPAPTVATSSILGTNPLGFLTQASLLPGIPNWLIIGGLLVFATTAGGSSGRKR